MVLIKNIFRKLGTKGRIFLLLGVIAILIVSIFFTLKDIINNPRTLETFESEALNDVNNSLPENVINNVSNEINNIIDISQLEEPKKEEVPKKSTTNTNTKKSSGATYYIKVNYGAQVVTIYKKDNDGNYTVPVKAMVCSTGTATPTSGVYSIPARWEWLRMQGGVYGHYVTQIKGNILFHSVPYLRKGDNASLEYWEYDKLGTKASLGCVRLQAKDAKWIYDNCSKGTKVEFYSSSNPGPLGKPTAKKISNYSDELRNWDPTDPASNNPWKNANKTENTKKPVTQEKPTNTNSITNTTQTNNTQTNNTQTNNTQTNNTQTNNTQINNTQTNSKTETNKNDVSQIKNNI